jgi:predicted secreted protein
MSSVVSHTLRLLAAWTASAVAVGTAAAQMPPQGPPQPTVSVTASAMATVPNDRLQAWLRAEAENASSGAAASQVNAAVAKALASAKSYPAVKVATAGYSTYQVGDKPGAQRWHVTQTISLESQDFTAATTLITRLQEEGLLLSAMAFSLTDKARQDAEDGVTQQAIKGWQERAQRAAQGLGFSSWRPGHVIVQTNDGGRVYPVMRAQAMAAPASGAPVATEAGTTDVSVSVSGDALLGEPRPPIAR